MIISIFPLSIRIKIIPKYNLIESQSCLKSLFILRLTAIFDFAVSVRKNVYSNPVRFWSSQAIYILEGIKGAPSRWKIYS
jgi:hypothetical protein